MGLHPCQKCGACCSIYQVSFQSSEDFVPAEHVVKVSEKESALKFENPQKKRCTALLGKIGESVGCKIYENRPSPCRNFKASFEDGIHNERCDEARAKMGLAPLTMAEWGHQPAI